MLMIKLAKKTLVIRLTVTSSAFELWCMLAETRFRRTGIARKTHWNQ